MTEAKLRDLSDDSELDAVAKAVKEKKLFTAGVLLISYCLNFLNQCIYISMSSGNRGDPGMTRQL